ncbi:MAG: hypothetical protein ACUVWX_12590 [Kiritimatiellia bacterium]
MTVFRRTGHPLIRGFELMKPYLRDARRWEIGIARLTHAYFLPALREREMLTVFSSANCGYGTNHLAVELSALSAFVSVFGTRIDASQLSADAMRLRPYACEYLARFMAYMDEGGYWAECDGLANQYNKLTGSALFRAAMDLGEVEQYRAAFERAAHFHTRYLFPNLYSVGVTDGRNRQAPCVDGMSFCGLCAEGRELLRLVARQQLSKTSQGIRFSGEALAELVTTIRAEPYYSTRTSSLIWETDSFTATIRDDFVVLKRGPWMAALSNFVFRPRPEGHWNLDYQNLFSLYHSRFGIVFYGNNSKNDPDLSTFNKDFMRFDGRPLEKPMRKYVPGKGHFKLAADGFELMREYRGFEGYVRLQLCSDGKANLSIHVNTRLSEYPVNCVLQPAASYGRPFTDGQGNRIEVGLTPFRFSGVQLGGAVILEPEPRPCAISESPGQPLRLSLPSDAELLWPFKPWDPYNLETDRCEKPEQWLVVLKIPVRREGVRLGIGIL